MFSIELSARKNSQGKYPVRIRVWGPSRKDPSKRAETTITLKVKPCTREEWNKDSRRYRRNVKDAKLMNNALGIIEKRCEAISKAVALKVPIGTVEDFKELYKDAPKKDKGAVTVRDKFDEIIEDETSRNMKTLEGYVTSRNIWKKFMRDPVPIKDLDYRTLKEYIMFLQNRGNAKCTVRIRLSHLQTMYNDEQRSGGIPRDIPYPFEGINWSKWRVVEREHDDMDQEQFKKFCALEVKPGHDELFKDVYMFLVYSYGMNFKDLVYLKKRNIKGNYIIYTRAKTKDKASEGKIMVPIHKKARALMDKYDNGTEMVFPIHDGKKRTPKKEQTYYNGRLRMFRKVLKRITRNEESLKDVKITPYTARHSFANIAYNMGASLRSISKSLGHSTEKMTLAYLKKRNLIVDDDNILDDL